MSVESWLEVRHGYKVPTRGLQERVLHPYIREQASTSPSKVGLLLSLVGVDNWPEGVDDSRDVPRGEMAEFLERVTVRRNRIAHTGDRVGHSALSSTNDDLDSRHGRETRCSRWGQIKQAQTPQVGPNQTSVPSRWRTAGGSPYCRTDLGRRSPRRRPAHRERESRSSTPQQCTVGVDHVPDQLGCQFLRLPAQHIPRQRCVPDQVVHLGRPQVPRVEPDVALSVEPRVLECESDEVPHGVQRPRRDDVVCRLICPEHPPLDNGVPRGAAPVSGEPPG